MYPPLGEAVGNAEKNLRCPNHDLWGLYAASNGVTHGWLSVLPIEDSRDLRRTWDGLLRANDPAHTKFLDRNRNLLERFLVFAQLDGLNCAVIDRTDSSIWYQDDEGLHRTDMSIDEFVDACLREMSDD